MRVANDAYVVWNTIGILIMDKTTKCEVAFCVSNVAVITTHTPTHPARWVGMCSLRVIAVAVVSV